MNTKSFIRSTAQGAVGLLLLLGAPGLALATASTLTGVSVGSQTGSLSAGVAGSVTYVVTVTRTGSGNIDIDLTVPSGLPTGATASFNPTQISFTGNVPTSGTSSMTITTTAATPAGVSSPVVKAKDHTAATNFTYAASLLVKTGQTITVNTHAPANATYGNSFGVAATSDSGLDVAITTTGGCTGSGTDGATLTMTSGTTACVVHYNQAGDGVYGVAPEVTETVIAQKVPLTISGMTFNSQAYDGGTTAESMNSAGSLVGVVSGDGAAEVSINAVTGTYTFADPNVGNGKAVTVSGVSLMGTKTSDYSLTQPTDVTVDVTPRPITVTADAKSKTYGDPDPALTYGVTGTLVGSDSFTGALARDPGEDVADYTINQNTLALTSNYGITYTPATFSIGTKAVLTVTADNKSITYGDSDPAFTFQYSGFVNEDNSSAIDTPPTCTVSGAHTHVNDYDITCSGGSDNDYSFSYVSGVLTVNKADADISVTPYNVTYDGEPHTAAGTATGVGEDGSLDGLNLSGTTHTDVGTYEGDSWTFTDETGDYNDNSGTVDDNISEVPAVTTHTLTYTAGIHGSITGTTPQTVNDGENGTAVTAVADAGFHFASWSDGVLTFTRTDNDITADLSVTAGFSSDAASGSVGGGGVVGSGPLSVGYVNGGGVVLGTSTEAAAQAQCNKTLTQYIRTGRLNSPEQVKRLQVALNTIESANLTVNGVYDAATKAAVMAFQLKYKDDILAPWGLTSPTGVVYYTTQKKINELFCSSLFPLTAAQQAEIARIKAALDKQKNKTQ